MTNFGGIGNIPVYKSEFVPLHYPDGRVRLYQLLHWPDVRVLVHPTRWDAFFMAINQRDVFNHPEVQVLLGLKEAP